MKIILLFTIITTLFTGCSKQNFEADIIVSSYATHFIVSEIVGDELTVKNIIPENADLHEYEPTQKDIALATDATIVFYIDENFDAMLSQLDNAIPILDNLSNNYNNPHFWLSPKKMLEATDFIYQEIEKEYGDKFKSNYQELRVKIEALDLEYKEMLSDVENKTFIISHNSFEHLKDYGIDTIPLANSDHENNDTSQKNLLEIIDYVEKNEISYIAIEKGIACSTCDIISKEVDIKTIEIDSFEYTDETTDYFAIQQENLEILITILN